MGTCSYVLTGTEKGMRDTFGSTCHGAVSHYLIVLLLFSVQNKKQITIYVFAVPKTLCVIFWCKVFSQHISMCSISLSFIEYCNDQGKVMF